MEIGWRRASVLAQWARCASSSHFWVIGPVGIEAQIGDQFGPVPDRPRPDLPPPVLHVLIEPEDPAQRGALFAGLTSLADEDPLIGLHLDESVGQAGLTLHGEVQKEVIAARLAEYARACVRNRGGVATGNESSGAAGLSQR